MKTELAAERKEALRRVAALRTQLQRRKEELAGELLRADAQLEVTAMNQTFLAAARRDLALLDGQGRSLPQLSPPWPEGRI